MLIADLFVGVVSIALGVIALATAIFNWDLGFHLPKAQSLQSRFGRRGARLFYAVLGVVLIVLGCAVIAGFAPFAGRPP